MADIAVRASNVGKLYRLGRVHDHRPTLRAALASTAARLGGRLKPGARKARPASDFWALRDVSFEIREGEAVAFIGRNGAGKSTLLKILSRITRPTEGGVAMRGRVGSLLEVGTGFHPELTGRDNVYLNGAILGMKKSEIDRKFDEIVAFAEVGPFLDTPVKRYSSGMQVRLAFAVAAHLETQILIADEVLAVGDAAFQKKCLGKMESVARQGRTVLFVSHNLAAARSLCHRGILLQNGRIRADGEMSAVVEGYLKGMEEVGAHDLAERQDRRGTGEVRITRVEVTGSGGVGGALVTGSPACFVIHMDRAISGLTCSFTVYDALGQPITAFDSAAGGPGDLRSSAADARFICRIEELLLIPGRYRINVAIARNGEMLDHVEAAAFLDVDHGLVQGRQVAPQSGYGSVVLPHHWTAPA